MSDLIGQVVKCLSFAIISLDKRLIRLALVGCRKLTKASRFIYWTNFEYLYSKILPVIFTFLLLQMLLNWLALLGLVLVQTAMQLNCAFLK